MEVAIKRGKVEPRVKLTTEHKTDLSCHLLERVNIVEVGTISHLILRYPIIERCRGRKIPGAKLLCNLSAVIIIQLEGRPREAALPNAVEDRGRRG